MVDILIFVSVCDDGEDLKIAYCKEGDRCIRTPIGKYRHPETYVCTQCPSGATTQGEGFKFCGMYFILFTTQGSSLKLIG